MIKTALLVVGLAIFGVLAYATTLPDTFRVERSLLVRSEPSRVFPLINSFAAWDQWSPWASRDAAIEERLSGAASGLGAIYQWSGNREVGSGRMEIIDTSPSSMVRIELKLSEPLATTNMFEFSLDPVDGYTEVTWRIDGPMPYVAKLASVFIAMDDRIGPDFESGLARLKALAER